MENKIKKWSKILELKIINELFKRLEHSTLFEIKNNLEKSMKLKYFNQNFPPSKELIEVFNKLDQFFKSNYPNLKNKEIINK